jgi:hypothetical protein
MKFPILFRKFVSLYAFLAPFWLWSSVRSMAVSSRCLIPRIKDILSIFPCISSRRKEEVGSVSNIGTNARFLEAYLGQLAALLLGGGSGSIMNGTRGSVL